MISLNVLIPLVDRIFEVYRWIILARVLMSWFPNLDRTHPVVVFLYQVTEPVLKPFRQIIPAVSGIDFSPIVVFILINFVRQIVISFMIRMML